MSSACSLTNKACWAGCSSHCHNLRSWKIGSARTRTDLLNYQILLSTHAHWVPTKDSIIGVIRQRQRRTHEKPAHEQSTCHWLMQLSHHWSCRKSRVSILNWPMAHNCLFRIYPPVYVRDGSNVGSYYPVNGFPMLRESHNFTRRQAYLKSLPGEWQSIWFVNNQCVREMLIFV